MASCLLTHKRMVEQPHFEDEITKLTARPVVPLEEIDTKVKHRRRWFLGGAFAMAMLLGAATALVSAYFKIRNAPDPEIQSLSVTEPKPVMPVVEIIPERPKPRPRDTDIDSDLEDRTVRSNYPVVEPHLDEDEALRRIRDAVLSDSWEERRERRVERRERRDRRRAQHRDRDLSNIDEIFEGPHRP